MTLNNINFGENQFCGPSVISAITGISTDEAAERIRLIRKDYTYHKPVTVVTMEEIAAALKELGYDTKFVRPLGSLFMTCSYLTSQPDAIYLVAVPAHVVLIEVENKKVYFLDNHTKKVMGAAHSARMMQRVTHVWKVIKK